MITNYFLSAGAETCDLLFMILLKMQRPHINSHSICLSPWDESSFNIYDLKDK
jgi:hypothetical protein